ncbi:MAG: DUF5615 family PIN-like protein [Candidatus Binatia bacterium]
MTIRLYLDEDTMDTALLSALRARGLDVMTALEANMIERPDEDHLAFAARKGRVLYSFNVADYYRLQAQGVSHAGLILAQQQRYTVGEQMRRLLGLAAAKSAAEMRDQVEFLSAWA